MEILETLKAAVEEKVSDIFIVSGFPLAFKKDEKILPQNDIKLMPNDTQEIIGQIYEMASRSMSKVLNEGDDDFSFSIASLGRFRCSAYKQRGSYAMVLRVVYFELPDPIKLNIPQEVMNLHKINRGMVLVTGSAGSGKTTTLACLIDSINKTRNNHIITIEDPLEFMHRHDKSIVTQREVEHDTASYAKALRAALRQAPDVILLGELRDFETIQTAVTTAETGHLMLSTMHTIGAAKTIDRIIDVFPATQQQQVRVQLSMALAAVVSQQLIPSVHGGMVPAFEVMIINTAIRNLIRESKIYQVDNVIHSSTAEGMMAMDDSIIKLYKAGEISADNAILYSMNPESMTKKI